MLSGAWGPMDMGITILRGVLVGVVMDCIRVDKGDAFERVF